MNEADILETTYEDSCIIERLTEETISLVAGIFCMKKVNKFKRL
ncbi:hypothetical protein EfmAA242_23660 [Enterococcus faecium]|nr:hypothetical protein EfmAA242_23660 [Enterococcus faecium]